MRLSLTPFSLARVHQVREADEGPADRRLQLGKSAKADSDAPTVERPAPVPPVALPPSLVLPPLPTFPSSLYQHVTAPTEVWVPPVAHTYAPLSALRSTTLGPPPTPTRPVLTAKQYSLSQHSLASGLGAPPPPPSSHAFEEQPWSLAFLLN